VSTGQILNSQLAQLAADRLEDIFIAGRRCRPDFVAGTELVRAGLLKGEIGWLHIGPGVDLPLNFCQRGPRFFLGAVTAPQLLALAIDYTGVHGRW
jgi:hypothetical protein